MRNKIRLQRVEKTDEHIRLLFELLNDRQFRISHESQPTYSEHKGFVESDPYRAWYFVFCEERIIGSFYLCSDNSIGLNLNDQNVDIVRAILIYIKKNYQPFRAIPSFVPPYFSINVANANTDLMLILRDIGCKEIQRTFQYQ